MSELGGTGLCYLIQTSAAPTCVSNSLHVAMILCHLQLTIELFMKMLGLLVNHYYDVSHLFA